MSQIRFRNPECGRSFQERILFDHRLRQAAPVHEKREKRSTRRTLWGLCREIVGGRAIKTKSAAWFRSHPSDRVSGYPVCLRGLHGRLVLTYPENSVDNCLLEVKRLAADIDDAAALE